MSIELSSELEQLVQSKVASGRYQSASDVLKDALGLLEEREIYTELHRDEIRRRITAGYQSLRAGNGVDGDAVFERIEREIAAMEPPSA
jgi:antitoxin ParD1/3/4